MALLDGVDLSNPCLVWPKLQEAYYKLVAGETEVRVRFREREVELSRVNLSLLQREIEQLKAACERRSGRRARFALRAGFRPRGPGSDFIGG
ncbi:MAG: gpW family head-tail joining protein [Phenylobacterium sp.]|uniref:gpW family head-tail joining protein n=1 Tax=Phenylobacterium sp. TaxID=1871053 RepID=UPI002734E484|nr:gpW family head-tail joining protein [Phenylobacterium sp.]MDP1642728.1 gpW family head-tail joining protein [Phenylobacterium sp.]MDP3117224.1 gpW family head-tail joining protein [Phenylobacterium sp.]